MVFVEQARAAARARQALERLGGQPKARVMEMGAARFLRSTVPGGPVDVVFLDPPYHRDALAEFVPVIDAGGWVKSGGLVYLEAKRRVRPLCRHIGSCSNRSRPARWVSSGARQCARYGDRAG